MGVFLSGFVGGEAWAEFPHVRGGVSLSYPALQGWGEVSPRTWGCFQIVLPFPLFITSFPTYVGVFPNVLEPLRVYFQFPHVRGGVSHSLGVGGRTGLSFPTYVGVFPPLAAFVALKRMLAYP